MVMLVICFDARVLAFTQRLMMMIVLSLYAYGVVISVLYWWYIVYDFFDIVLAVHCVLCFQYCVGGTLCTISSTLCWHIVYGV